MPIMGLICNWSCQAYFDVKHHIRQMFTICTLPLPLKLHTMKLVTLFSLLSFFWVFYQIWYEDPERSIPGKLLWTLAALFFSIPTALFYFFSQKRRMK